MKQWNITAPLTTISSDLRAKIDNLTKPRGSLGRLEELALQIGLIQQTLTPSLRRPVNILFGGDHGVIDEGVTVSPKEVTWQQMLHFPRGGAGISYLCRQHGFELRVVDAAVDFDFPPHSGVIDRKIMRGTANFLHDAAMTEGQLHDALRHGAEQVDIEATEGTNIISLGEMGSGNTSASALWMHFLTGLPLEDCVGAGAGLDNAGIARKLDVLRRAAHTHSRLYDMPDGPDKALQVMRTFGGAEMVMAVGAMLRAAELHMVILVDGFIMTACILAASRIAPAILDYAIFGHCGDESGHRRMLDHIGARPLLNLSLRLGEGSGAVCAFPIVDSAVRMINEMDSFKAVSVTKYF